MSLASFGAVLGTFQTGTYAVSRRTATTTGTDGRTVLGTESTFNIDASVQNLTGKELQQLSESQRTSERRNLWTLSTLRTLAAAGAADRVTIDGAVWLVEKLEDYLVLGGFYKVTVVREGSVV